MSTELTNSSGEVDFSAINDDGICRQMLKDFADGCPNYTPVQVVLGPNRRFTATDAYMLRPPMLKDDGSIEDGYICEEDGRLAMVNYSDGVLTMNTTLPKNRGDINDFRAWVGLLIDFAEERHRLVRQGLIAKIVLSAWESKSQTSGIVPQQRTVEPYVHKDFRYEQLKAAKEKRDKEAKKAKEAARKEAGRIRPAQKIC